MNFKHTHKKNTHFKGLNDVSYSIFNETHERAEKFSKYAMVLSIIAASGVYVLPFLSPAYRWISGTYTAEAWYLPYKVMSVIVINDTEWKQFKNSFHFYFNSSFPFDTKTSNIGFGIGLLLCDAAGLAATTFFAVMISFFINMCWYFVAYVTDMMNIFQQIDNELNRQPDGTAPKPIIIQYLIEFIRLHAWSVRLVNHEILQNARDQLSINWNLVRKISWWLASYRSTFANFMSLLIFLIIGVFVICICTLLYQIQVVSC